MHHQNDQSERPFQSPTGDETIDLLDYFEVIVKRKRLIIRTTLAAFVISIVVSLLMPKIYSSTAMILPPQQDQGLMGMMMGQMGGGMASLAGDLLGKSSPADMYVGILNSEAVSDAIIDRFKLMEAYDIKFRIDTYKALNKNVDVAVGKKDGIISITVEDKDPKRAADMANAYVEELGRLTVRLNISGAGQNKSFLEERLSKTKIDLARAEENLKNFQARNKVLDVAEQAKGAIQGVAGLMAQLAAEQVKLAALQHSMTDASEEVRTQKAVIAGLRGEIARFEGGGKGGSIPTVGSMPALGQEYLRLMREFKIQETLVELLTKQYEMAKLTEAKDLSTLQVIQQARVPDKKSKPKRGLLVLMTTFVTSCLAVFLAFVLEHVETMPEEERERWRGMGTSFAFRRRG